MANKHIVLFDGRAHQSLLPLTYTRPVAACMIGMDTIAEKWERDYSCTTSLLTQEYLQDLYPLKNKISSKLYINGACLPTADLTASIDSLKTDEALYFDGELIAFHENGASITDLKSIETTISGRRKVILSTVQMIRFPEDILSLSTASFLRSYEKNICESATISDSSRVLIRGEKIHIGKNVKIYDAILNAEEGPIYIDDDAEIMENAVIKGPVYIGKGTHIHVGSKIYASTFLGPECRIGGEVKRTQIFGYTNKGHEGYLGDSVLGYWCNLGANTDNSNMKNTYGKVSLWDITNESYRTTAKQFLGMILGDHTMAAIKTSFNTGSVTGVYANVLDRSPDRYSRSFSWGKDQQYNIEKALEVANQVMKRRGKSVDQAYENMLRYLHKHS